MEVRDEFSRLDERRDATLDGRDSDSFRFRERIAANRHEPGDGPG